jgi:Flp pilus assembly CpaE family ATPase
MSLALFDSADVALEVITPDRGVARNARRLGKALATAGYTPDKFTIALNRSDMPGTNPAAVAAELQRPPDVFLPNEPALAMPNNGPLPPIVLAHPEAPLSRSLVQLAWALVSPKTTAGVGAA